MDFSDPAAQEALRLLDRMYSRLNRRRPYYTQELDYFKGKHPLKYATAEWKKANAALYADFADNWTAPVVNAELERISHIGLKFGEESNSDAARTLWNVWQRNECDMQSSQGWLSTLANSRTFVLVWGDPATDEPEITWEDGSTAEIEYDWFNPRKRKAGLKSWVDETTEFANVYLADDVYKFQRPRAEQKDARESQAEQRRTNGTDGGWVAREVAGEPWPIPNPMGEVPLVEMPNRPLLGGDAISEIRGVMAMQDSINLMWAYMFLAADYASMDARIVLNAEPPQRVILDSNGQKIGTKPVDMQELREKRLAFFTGNGLQPASLGTFPKASLGGFIEVIDEAVAHIASQTRTPPTYLVSKVGMSNVNGEGLKASEIGLVKKTIEFQRFISPALREVYRLIALAMSKSKLADAARLATMRWMNPEIRSEAELADSLVKKKSIGYPFEYLMEIDGLSPTEISRVLTMRDDEQAMLRIMPKAGDADAADGGTPDEPAGEDRRGGGSGPAATVADAGN